jgi:hypothetical protein
MKGYENLNRFSVWTFLLLLPVMITCVTKNHIKTNLAENFRIKRFTALKILKIFVPKDSLASVCKIDGSML